MAALLHGAPPGHRAAGCALLSRTGAFRSVVTSTEQVDRKLFKHSSGASGDSTLLVWMMGSSHGGKDPAGGQPAGLFGPGFGGSFGSSLFSGQGFRTIPPTGCSPRPLRRSSSRAPLEFEFRTGRRCRLARAAGSPQPVGIGCTWPEGFIRAK